MEYKAKSGNPEKQRSNCLVVTVSQPRKLSATATVVDKACGNALSTILRKGDMDGRSGQTLILHNLKGVAADRVLLVGTGTDKDFSEVTFNKVINSTVTALGNSGAKDAHVCFGDIRIKGRNPDWFTRQAVLLVNACQYSFEQIKSQKSDGKPKLRKLTFEVASKAQLKNAETAIQQGIAIGTGMDRARDLGNLPGNVCTPGYIAKQAKLLAKGQKQLTVKVLEEADMRKLKMGSLLSVSAGSRQPAKLITLEYKGAPAKEKPIVLVGKGVTFDTGGIS